MEIRFDIFATMKGMKHDGTQIGLHLASGKSLVTSLPSSPTNTNILAHPKFPLNTRTQTIWVSFLVTPNRFPNRRLSANQSMKNRPGNTVSLEASTTPQTKRIQTPPTTRETAPSTSLSMKSRPRSMASLEAGATRQIRHTQTPPTAREAAPPRHPPTGAVAASSAGQPRPATAAASAAACSTGASGTATETRWTLASSKPASVS